MSLLTLIGLLVSLVCCIILMGMKLPPTTRDLPKFIVTLCTLSGGLFVTFVGIIGRVVEKL
jgi:hypothetical protein